MENPSIIKVNMAIIIEDFCIKEYNYSGSDVITSFAIITVVFFFFFWKFPVNSSKDFFFSFDGFNCLPLTT
jgi:hypothetical protein